MALDGIWSTEVIDAARAGTIAKPLPLITLPVLMVETDDIPPEATLLSDGTINSGHSIDGVAS
jgi:hypothetical protein